MPITQADYEHIAHLLPLPRGNVKIGHVALLNAFRHVIANGCKWRELPAAFGNRHAI